MRKCPNVNYWLARNKVDTRRGAPMGRPDYPHPEGDRFAGTVSVQRCRWVDGDYTPDGTYWGQSDGMGDIWMLLIKDNSSDEGAYYHFVRASSRFAAVDKAVSIYPKADVEGKEWWGKLSKILDVHRELEQW